MSWSNEDYIEELLWFAHEKGKGNLLLESASKIEKEQKVGRSTAFSIAAKQLNIEIPD